ncbi:hypothetical protein AB0H18_30395 [Streptomyces sp. NPDC020766]|uniref:hypothetical protein n=2 Tax=unclassified Streptomyces TaxID=2593676 RepID=UPI0033FFDE83
MRHPPRSSLLVVGAPAFPLMGTAVAPLVTASGAAPACTVECSGHALISRYDGTPTSFGIGPRDRLRSLDG